MPPQQERRRAKRDRHDGGHRQHRLMIGGEIKRDAGAERDRHPGQQPPGAGFGARPLRASVSTNGGQSAGRDGAKPPAGAAGTRRPGPGIAPPPARRVALLRHATAPYDLCRAQGYRTWHAAGKRNGCRNRRKCTSTGATLHHPGNSDKGRRSHEACGLHFDCAGDIGFAVCIGCARAMPFHRGAAATRGVLSAPGNGARRPAEALETQQAAQSKPYEPMTAEDAQLGKSHPGHLPRVLGDALALLLDQRRLRRDVMADDLPVAVFADDHPGDLDRQRLGVRVDDKRSPCRRR